MQTAFQKTILLVEDEALIAMAERRTLAAEGYTVITVSSGEDAIAEIDQTESIDLVLMDIDLGPGIDGTEAAERILTRHDVRTGQRFLGEVRGCFFGISRSMRASLLSSSL